MPNGKAGGYDGVIFEMLKCTKVTIVPILHKLFNAIFDSGCYPQTWCDAMLTPVHKQGNINDENNYRGISLLSALGKLFTRLLNNRLYFWAENNGKLFESQAGFRKGYSTIDKVFTLQAMCHKYLSRQGGRFYCAFVDFEGIRSYSS